MSPANRKWLYLLALLVADALLITVLAFGWLIIGLPRLPNNLDLLGRQAGVRIYADTGELLYTLDRRVREVSADQETLGRAFEALEPGDTLLVPPGEYRIVLSKGQLAVPAGVTLLGQGGKSKFIFHKEGLGYGYCLIRAFFHRHRMIYWF